MHCKVGAVPFLDTSTPPTPTASLQLPHSLSLFHHSALSRCLSRFASPSLSIWITLPASTSPWSEFLSCFFFSAAVALLLGHISLRRPRADPETQNAPHPLTPSPLRPLSVCLGASPRCFLSCRPSFLTPPLPLISPLLAVAHIPFLMQCNLWSSPSLLPFCLLSFANILPYLSHFFLRPFFSSLHPQTDNGIQYNTDKTWNPWLSNEGAVLLIWCTLIDLLC